MKCTPQDTEKLPRSNYDDPLEVQYLHLTSIGVVYRDRCFCFCLLRLGLAVTGAPAENFGTLIHGVSLRRLKTQHGLSVISRAVRANCTDRLCARSHVMALTT